MMRLWMLLIIAGLALGVVVSNRAGAQTVDRFQGLFIGSAVSITRATMLIEYDGRTVLVPPPGFVDLKAPALQESF